VSAAKGDQSMTIPRFIDTHHHLWDLENNPYPWLMEDIGHFVGDYSPIRRTYLISDFRQDADRLPLQKSVHVQAEWDHHDDPVKETAWLQSVADAPASNGMPNGIVGFANLSDPNVEEVLARHTQHRNFRGIRHMLNFADDPSLRFAERGDLMDDPQWRRGFRSLARFDASFDLQVWPWQLEQAARLAKDIPEVRVILNHTGMPKDWDPDSIELWRNGMRALAAAPTVAVKISALSMMDRSWTTQKIRPFVLDTIEIFGVDRCMFASNFPVDSLMASYRGLWNAYDAITADFSSDERDKLFYTNAEKYYRI
jgi:predicted TIM-barrel fold metal-dependent hydrolase